MLTIFKIKAQATSSKTGIKMAPTPECAHGFQEDLCPNVRLKIFKNRLTNSVIWVVCNEIEPLEFNSVC